MTKKTTPVNNRIGRILEFITRLAAGDLSKTEMPSGKDDDLDGIIIGLNMLAEELTYRLISMTEAEKRLDEIMAVIMACIPGRACINTGIGIGIGMPGLPSEVTCRLRFFFMH